MYSYSTINHSPLFSSLPSLKTQINLLQSCYPTLALLCLRCVSVSALGWRLIDRTEPLACSYYGNHPNKMLLRLRTTTLVKPTHTHAVLSYSVRRVSHPSLPHLPFGRASPPVQNPLELKHRYMSWGCPRFSYQEENLLA